LQPALQRRFAHFWHPGYVLDRMSKKTSDCIRLRGVRQNNLKNIDLDVPLRKLVVISGLSGSGKSSLAFETLFAEGQRRYIETFSPYARQFLDRMDKPQARRIEGIPPAIAIEQRNSVKSSRSTVGTMTEIADYAKVFWAQLARLHCRRCGQPVAQEPPGKIWPFLRGLAGEADALVTFTLDLSAKFSLEESLALIGRQGYRRLLLDGEPVALEDALARLKDIPTHQEKPTARRGAPRPATPNMLEETSSAIGPIRPFKAAQEPFPAAGTHCGVAPPARSGAQLTVIQDRVKLKESNRARFIEACEQAYHFGQGRLAVHWQAAEGGASQTRHFSNRLHCATCDLEYREPSPALFSFNHPVGACPACKGFGRIIAINYNAAIPDRSKSLAGGAVKPWQTKTGAECQADMLKFARLRRVPVDTPFRDLSKEHRDWVIEGDPGYGKDKAHEWPRAWYGVRGYFRWLESKSYKMHVRVLLARYRKYDTCPDCHGARFQPETLLYRIDAPGQLPIADRGLGMDTKRKSVAPIHPSHNSHPSHPAAIPSAPRTLTLADFYRQPARDALQFVQALIAAQPQSKSTDPRLLALNEVRSRLTFLLDAGLGYLSLDRMTRSLSGGETERVSLTSCLGSRLVNTLFVLDEPSVGLHPRDTARLVRIVRQLRDAGNTVVVVEHEASVMRAADQIIDLGPGHGASGGEVVFQGTYREILRAPHSLTGQYLSGKKRIEIPERRPVFARVHLGEPGGQGRESVASAPVLVLRGATLHNLRNLTVEIPLGRLVCVTGVSGSGKSTLVRDVLLPALQERLSGDTATPETDEDDVGETPESAALPSGPSLEGWEHLGLVVAVDQSLLGRTPRSNPAVYIGAFDEIRQLFTRTEAARQRGLNASAFSFNSAQGQCQRCRGAGFEKIEMQFLSDVFVRCPDCDGLRYRPHILEVTAAPEGGPSWSIADLLEATVDEAIAYLNRFGSSRYAERAVASLKLLQEVGLGYLRLGQPINTLSGGESQRLKLVSHLARSGASHSETAKDAAKPALFIFDEPTTGLHFDDVRVLLKVFQRLVAAGHSVLVIEHNLDVIKSSDWVIDLGPEGGEEGGKIVAQGTPEEIAASPQSHTGEALGSMLFHQNHDGKKGKKEQGR
jgi:excinuclease ABC subunit A